MIIDRAKYVLALDYTKCEQDAKALADYLQDNVSRFPTPEVFWAWVKGDVPFGFENSFWGEVFTLIRQQLGGKRLDEAPVNACEYTDYLADKWLGNAVNSRIKTRKRTQIDYEEFFNTFSDENGWPHND